jgi:hypothetical protein
MVVSLSGRSKVVFTKMDKLERWARGRDIQVGVASFLSIRLTPMLAKEWLQGITRYTPERIESVV